MKHNKLNVLLVEILISVLFFALASTVILQLFVSARSQSENAGVGDSALVELQNIEECLYVADRAEEWLLYNGFVEGKDCFVLETDQFSIIAEPHYECTSCGTIRVIDLTAWIDGKSLFGIKSTKYLPAEVR